MRVAIAIFDAHEAAGCAVCVATASDEEGGAVAGCADATCAVDGFAGLDDAGCCGWLWSKLAPLPSPPSVELPRIPGRRRRPKGPKYSKVATSTPRQDFAIGGDSESDDEYSDDELTGESVL